jgi:hypothetical protein
VARPAVIAKVVAAPLRVPSVPPPTEVRRTTLLPPAPSAVEGPAPTAAELAAQAETDEFVARFLAKVSVPPAPHGPAESERSPRMAPIAQFMLAELPSYKVRRAAASVPPPPAHVFIDAAPPIPLDLPAIEIDSPLALVESWLPPAPEAELAEPEAASSFELGWRAESPWSVVDVEPHSYRVLGWDSTRPPAPVLALPIEPEPVPIAAVEVAPEPALAEESPPSSVEDPVVEVVQLMEIAPTPAAPEVAAAEVVPAVAPAVAESASMISQPEASEPTGAESAPSDGFGIFVAALAAVLLQRGATRGAAVIADLLGGTRVAADALGETLVQQLNGRGIGELRGDQFVVDEAFAQTASGWRTLLSSESADFSSCAETLDDWATGVVTALLPGHAPAKDVRRELRRKGVAAFGMLAAA